MSVSQLFGKNFRTTIETIISDYTKQKWKITSINDLSDRAVHPCAILSDGTFSVFIKYSKDLEGYQQFENEFNSLKYLKSKAAIRIPRLIGVFPNEMGTLFIQEALQEIKRNTLQWSQIGKTLACIHQVKSDYFGFHCNGYHGPLFLDNKQDQDWLTFYTERRIRPNLKTAVDSGNLPASIVLQVEKIINRLPELCGPNITPSLLHGDAQQNNFICTSEGTYVIDPAIHYGHPELDLAYLDSWQPVSNEVFEAYKEILPIDPGFSERRSLWLISLYLAAVAIEGEYYMDKLTSALKEYL